MRAIVINIAIVNRVPAIKHFLIALKSKAWDGLAGNNRSGKTSNGAFQKASLIANSLFSE